MLLQIQVYARNARGESKKVVLGNVAINSKNGNNGECNNNYKFVDQCTTTELCTNFKNSVNQNH